MRFLIVCFLILTTNLFAQEFKITANDAEADDCFGFTVSTCGEYAIIGAHQGDDYSGSAYIFIHNGDEWTQQAVLTADDADAWDLFGISVSINGAYAIVGAYGNDDDGEQSGSAYIFVRNGDEWSQQAKLTADDADAGDVFGNAVSISGNYAIVGAYQNDDNGDRSGSAYIFVRDGEEWSQQAKLTADDAGADDRFGECVSISGDYAIIGAIFNDDDGENSGSTYIFVRDGVEWSQQAKLTADDADAQDFFGMPVSISGEYAVIGAHHDGDNGENSGSAYIFIRERDEWTQQCKLTADDAAEDDEFGISVSISDSYAAVGARYNDDDGDRSGSAYIFIRDEDEWIQQVKLTANDADEGDVFGHSVSVGEGYTIVGAPQNDDDGEHSGS
ncbi:MAG: FG-GAP repeat protein, partial [Candidatus Electryoneaceae bacterium]|nr:FG-GAP repeat protein [Candidatus Electryoneaceae bacterium]